MEFDKVVLEGKKYQDLVKLAKERNVYRRYAPKAELIERLIDIKHEHPGDVDTNILSDVSMPSMNISEDDSVDESHLAAKKEGENAKENERAAKRSVLSPVNDIISHALRRTRKTVAFITPEQRTTPAKRFTRVSTPAKPLKTPTRKSNRKSSIATSTPAAKVAPRGNESQENELDCTFTIQDENTFSQMEEESPVPLKREGTFDIVTVGKSSEAVSPWSGVRGTRASRSSFSPMSESKTHEDLGVKELKNVFETEVKKSTGKKKSAVFSRSCRFSNVSPQLKAKSTRTSSLRASLRMSMPGRKSDARSSATIASPPAARQAFVTNRAKAAGRVKSDMKQMTKSLSIIKTPKLTSPSVAKEIELKQRTVSAKKMMGTASATKSKILPPRKVPNFNEIHAKMFSKMESLADDKQKVLERAQEYGNSAIPRCAVATPKFFSAEKSQKVVEKNRDVAPRPIAARQLKLPEKSKIPGRAVDAAASAVTVGRVVNSLDKKLHPKQVDTKPVNSPRKFLPANSLISRLPVLMSSRTTNRIGNVADGLKSASSQTQRMTETIINKAPAIKVQDIKSKNRQLLQNVRTNKRFELQMQHRMKSQA